MMGFLNGCKNVAFFFSTWLWSPYDGSYEPQRPLVPGHTKSLNSAGSFYDHAPKFPAPNGPEAGDFVCKYPLMGKEWTDCSTAKDRSCWLKGPKGKRFDITTDYDREWPVGITREYFLDVNEMTINGDGIPNPHGKVFNNTYPGPWIKACWGDTLKITVKNNLRYNGTTIHWHGFRQLGSPEMDGVNAISQCPIPPSIDGYTYTYTFNATQYGTSWAHSHYSLQYADGLLAPITIFGPSAAPYDEALDPILITDWNHRSAFQDWDQQLRPNPDFPKMNSALLNGKGNFAGNFPEKKFSTTVERGKKYLLRIINTSVDTTWIFSIDNHQFEVISSDFVPIKPYTTGNLTIGIGQRYHIVLNATPIAYPKTPVPDTDNFWIRIIGADKCKGFEPGNEPDERQGILRYSGSSEGTPTTYRPDYGTACKDEPFESLQPIVKWSVPPVDISTQDPPFDIRKTKSLANRPAQGNQFIWWALGDVPMWLNFSDPSILNLGTQIWDDHAVVIPHDLPADAWVYMAITAPPRPPPNKRGGFFPVAHPMHLHGHDFVLLGQGNDSSAIATTKLKFDNPPRRDVVLVPAGGFAIIAFRADNPGNWLLHCHIPWHASAGLALQILEREPSLIALMTDERLKPIRENCAKWDSWVGNKSNLWENGAHAFQDDSGI